MPAVEGANKVIYQRHGVPPNESEADKQRAELELRITQNNAQIEENKKINVRKELYS